ncbi:tetratricopeptide repeat protein [Kineosporia sp. NBRC 101677]|uniref:tetratricopeptide repeat protein n=1 Tax=Kineosporia sp. NBRC 101677 TaxID=3032197 RepID=UPI002552D68C|nr:tetratricopeptide repeat protein [Kineosporia sp. NBRC 101677]
MTKAPEPVEIAVGLMQEGRYGDAENLLVREVERAAQAHGVGSPEWASAQCDLGNILINAGRVDRAIECFRGAVTMTVHDEQNRKDQLTYRMNLGMALRMAGRLDEAETELRQGVAERLAFYGREHAGYAFGLEPLADLLRQRGDLTAAREVVEETVDNLWRNGNERLTWAMALRAQIVLAQGTGEPLFAGLDALPEELVAMVARTLCHRMDRSDPQSRVLLEVALGAVEHILGPDHQATLNLLSELANLKREQGDTQGRAELIERARDSYDRLGRPEEAVLTTLALALAHSEAGGVESSLATYASVGERVRQLGSPELTSHVLRNWGLALNEAGRSEQAEPVLAEAVSQGRRGADHDLLGRACVAFGLFLQHQERLAEAGPMIEEGLAVLDPVDPDALVGRSHLGAVHQGLSCGCGDLGTTMAAAFREFVSARLPADLLDRLEVELVDGDFKVDVHLRREPTEGELQRLNEVTSTAQAEFRRRVNGRH